MVSVLDQNGPPLIPEIGLYTADPRSWEGCNSISQPWLCGMKPSNTHAPRGPLPGAARHESIALKMFTQTVP